MWRSGLFAALFGLSVVAPSVAEAGLRSTLSTIPTFTRPVGASAQIIWTARVQPGETGEFELYRISGRHSQQVARLSGHAGTRGYRWVDRGSVDESASYELRWRSAGGATVVLGRLHCQRESTCQPLAAPSIHSSTALEMTPVAPLRFAPNPGGRPTIVVVVSAGRASAPPADPPPWRRGDTI